MNDQQKLSSWALSLTVVVALLSAPSQASATPILGPDLASFAVLAAEGVTNVPTSDIGGNLGSATNPSVGGGYNFAFGSLQPNTATAQAAQLQLDAAIVSLSAFGPGTTIPLSVGGNLDAFQALNGGTISPGTYTVLAQAVNLQGALVLDGGGSNSAVWVFQMPSTLITSTTSAVTIQNVGDGANVGVYWNVHSAATLNGPLFQGNVLAHDLISSDGDLTIPCGRLLSATTQVTLIMDHISIGCASGTVTGSGGEEVASSGGFDQGVVTGFQGIGGGSNGDTVPEPSSLLLLGTGLAWLARAVRRKVS